MPNGRPTAIGGRVRGYAARSGATGAPANGSDFPPAARRRLAERAASLREFAQAGLTTEEQAHVLTAGKLYPELAGRAELQAVRDYFPHLSPEQVRRLRAMPQIGDGTNQEAEVYADAATHSVFKLVEIEPDGRVHDGAISIIDVQLSGNPLAARGVPVEVPHATRPRT